MKSSYCGGCEQAAACDAASRPVVEVDASGRIVRTNVAADRLLGAAPLEATVWSMVGGSGLAWDLVPVAGAPDGVVARLCAHTVADAALLDAATTGIVARGITHDLNNLFTCILASATMPPAEGDVTRHLAAIEHAVLRGAELLALLRDLTARADRRSGRVAPAIETCAYLLERVGAKLGIDVVADAVEARVALAPHELQQILINLGLNAIDAMAATGGRLHLEATLDPPKVRLRVADSGPGIDPGLVARLFEIGHSTKRGHSGVGLAVVNQLVHRGGGSIRIESTPGAGTTVLIELPFVETA